MEQVTETTLNQPITQLMQIEIAYGCGYYEGSRRFKMPGPRFDPQYPKRSLAEYQAYKDGFAYAAIRQQDQGDYIPPDGWKIVPFHEHWAPGDHWSHGCNGTPTTQPTPVSTMLGRCTVAQLLQQDTGKGFILRRQSLTPATAGDWGEIANGPVVPE